MTEGSADNEKDRPRPGFIPVIRSTFRVSFSGRTFLVAAGLAFFGMFSLFPGIAVIGLLFQAFVASGGNQRS